jgi:hypothetical protein
MAIENQIIDLAIYLKQIGKLNSINSVLDMGDQDLNVNYEYLKNKLKHLKITEFENLFERSKYYPKRPRVSSSAFWQSLGINETDRLDLTQLERRNDVKHNFYKIDLNYPVDKRVVNKKYDLVTDIGNNEHPFNVSECFRSLHNFTSKNGLMLIQQSIFKGNGLYNFEIGFFESLAACNNYQILYSAYTISYNGIYFSLPIATDILDVININKVSTISVIYLFKKINDEDFNYTYQDLGKKPIREEFFSNSLNFENLPPERNYVPIHISHLSIKKMLNVILRKIKSKIFN